ncbi:MAG: hypothetical protein V1493_00175 [Candidatus Diapherotrites archaeon]
MNFKEFFKPTLGKAALFIFVFLIVPLPVYVANPGCIALEGKKCEPYWAFQHFLGYGVNWVSFELAVGSLWPSAIINLAISYILACAIVEVAKKAMKKKGK